MTKAFLISAMIVSLYANNDYIPVSKFSKEKQLKYNFIKPDNALSEENTQILENDLILKEKNKTNTPIITQVNNLEKIDEVEQVSDDGYFKINVSLSDFNSKSEQYIYSSSNGRKISQLTWEANNVKLLGLGIEQKTEDIGLFLNYKTNIRNGNGVMDDYDWIDDSNPDTWTHWSHHDNTEVEEVNILDLGINKEFTIYDKTKFIMSLGYKWEKQLFKAYDGSYIYSGSDLPSEFRTYTGTIDGKAITYEQEYKGFYLGAELQKEYKDFNFLFNLKYTPRMDVEFTDTHHLRIPSFTDYTSFDKTSMLSLGLGIDYNMDRNQMLSFSYDYTKYSYIRGNRVRSYTTGYDLPLPGTVGVESENDMINLQYTYKFLNTF